MKKLLLPLLLMFSFIVFSQTEGELKITDQVYFEETTVIISPRNMTLDIYEKELIASTDLQIL